MSQKPSGSLRSNLSKEPYSTTGRGWELQFSSTGGRPGSDSGALEPNYGQGFGGGCWGLASLGL